MDAQQEEKGHHKALSDAALLARRDNFPPPVAAAAAVPHAVAPSQASVNESEQQLNANQQRKPHMEPA